MLLEGQSKRALSLALRYRYVALALAVNTPGNSVIGGGGGIMIMAGLSGIFSPLSTFATVALAHFARKRGQRLDIGADAVEEKNGGMIAGLIKPPCSNP